MNKLSIQRGFFLASLFLLLFTNILEASYVFVNDNILPDKTVKKIDEIGSELYQKTGANIYVAVLNDKNLKSDIFSFEKKLSQKLKKPFILLTVFLSSQKIDIINSSELKKRFDKEQVLSPYPWSGTILPLLTAHTKNFRANVEAALLNGYADIADQIAASYGVELKSSMGSQNKNTYLVIKLIFYGTLFLILFNYLRHKYFLKK